jgi:hypothetical protein
LMAATRRMKGRLQLSYIVRKPFFFLMKQCEHRWMPFLAIQVGTPDTPTPNSYNHCTSRMLVRHQATASP